MAESQISSAEVWALLDGERSLAEIARVLADRKGKDEAQSLVEVERIVTEFEVKGLIKPRAQMPET